VLATRENRMTTLSGRPRTALLVIDVQNGVVGEAYHWSGHRAPGRTAGTIETAGVDFSTPG
jgi:hypothetical protein